MSWVQHVKDYQASEIAKGNKISYKDAMTAAKDSYVKQPKDQKEKQLKVQSKPKGNGKTYEENVKHALPKKRTKAKNKIKVDPDLIDVGDVEH